MPIDPAHAALLFIDVQNYTARPDGGEYAALSEAERDARYGWFFRVMREIAVPNMQRLQAACRLAGIEVMYTVIEALTRDGRDQSLDYKISGLFVPRGSWDAKVLDAIAPAEDEIVLREDVIVRVHLDQHRLRAAQSRRAVADHRRRADRSVHRLGGRDACDLGYLVTVPTDACATLSAERHDWSLRNNRGYCRQITTEELVREILAAGGDPP